MEPVVGLQGIWLMQPRKRGIITQYC